MFESEYDEDAGRDPEDEEAELAGAEAGAIGGRADDDKLYEGIDDAERPLAEAGEGESEGFELAESELEEHASHGDPAPDPEELAGKPEEQDPEGVVYGEADHEESSELEDDE